MKILFTKKMKIMLLNTYEYAITLFVLFGVLSYFTTPTSLIQTMGSVKDKIENIEIKREFNETRSVKSPSRGYSDFYQISLEFDSIPYRCYDVKNIKSFGLSNLCNQSVVIHFNNKGRYKIIRELILNGKLVIKKKDRGVFPFVLFVGLCIVSIIWSIWGFYITYLVSDKKRNEILGR